MILSMNRLGLNQSEELFIICKESGESMVRWPWRGPLVILATKWLMGSTLIEDRFRCWLILLDMIDESLIQTKNRSSYYWLRMDCSSMLTETLKKRINRLLT